MSESKKIFGTVQKLSPYIGVSYNLVLQSTKGYIGSSKYHKIFVLKIYHAKFGQRIQNHFSGKVRQTLELFKKFLPIFVFPMNLF